MELFFPPLKNHTPSVMLSFYYYTGMFFLYLQKVRKEIGKKRTCKCNKLLSCSGVTGCSIRMSVLGEIQKRYYKKRTIYNVITPKLS